MRKSFDVAMSHLLQMIFVSRLVGDQFVFQIGLATVNPFKSQVAISSLSNDNQSFSITMIRKHDDMIILTTSRDENEHMIPNSVKQ